MTSRLVSLQEFQKLTGLSDKALVYLLKQNLLRCSVSDQSLLMVDLESVEIQHLQAAILERHGEVLNLNSTVISETLGTIVRDHLDVIVNEALGRFLSGRSAE